MNPPMALSRFIMRLPALTRWSRTDGGRGGAAPVRQWRTPALVVAALVAAWLVGWYGPARSPLLLAGALVAVPLAAAVLRDLRIALVGTIAVIALLPFGVAPLRLGASPTLLELVLLMTLGGWLARRVATGRGPVRLTVAGPWILLFQATLIAAQIATLAQSGSLSVVRMIFKLELAILFFFVCASLTASHDWRRVLIRSVVVIGACEALVALVLFAAPRELALRVLLRLGPLGYPTDSTVLRYLPDTDRLRAIGTAIDPNVLGALLMIVGIITLTQLLASEPVLPRRWLVIAAVVVLPALLVTFSRSSWLGLAAGVGLTALVRYRRLLPLMGAAAVAFALWPTTQRYALHLLSGLRAQDRAAAMRLGELENAWQIIQAYPWLGIGFGDAPTMTLYPWCLQRLSDDCRAGRSHRDGGLRRRSDRSPGSRHDPLVAPSRRARCRPLAECAGGARRGARRQHVGSPLRPLAASRGALLGLDRTGRGCCLRPWRLTPSVPGSR